MLRTTSVPSYKCMNQNDSGGWCCVFQTAGWLQSQGIYLVGRGICGFQWILLPPGWPYCIILMSSDPLAILVRSCWDIRVTRAINTIQLHLPLIYSPGCMEYVAAGCLHFCYVCCVWGHLGRGWHCVSTSCVYLCCFHPFKRLQET